jgi:hypothetical protein
MTRSYNGRSKPLSNIPRVTYPTPHKPWRAATCAAFVGLLLGASNLPARSEQPQPSGSFLVTAATAAGRLRIGSAPGDLGLRTVRVTAVVRKADGWLVDFWTNQRILPTAPQLKDVTNADGLWQLTPYLDDGQKARAVVYDEVEIVDDVIVATANVSVAGTLLRVQTATSSVERNPKWC